MDYYEKMNQNAVAIITEYLDVSLFPPAGNWPDCEFEQRTYARWVGNEILKAVQQNSRIPPVIVIEQMQRKLKDFSYVTEDTPQSLLFAIASDTAEEIGILFV